MSSRRLSPGTGAGPKTTDPPRSIPSDDEGAVVTREDGDRIFASSLAASTLAASHPRLGSARRSARARLTPLDDPLVEALSDALHRVVGSSAFVLARTRATEPPRARRRARGSRARRRVRTPPAARARGGGARARGAERRPREGRDPPLSRPARARQLCRIAPRKKHSCIGRRRRVGVFRRVRPGAAFVLARRRDRGGHERPRQRLPRRGRPAPRRQRVRGPARLDSRDAARRAGARRRRRERFARVRPRGGDASRGARRGRRVSPRDAREDPRGVRARAARAFPRSRTRFEPRRVAPRTRSTCRAAA